MRVLVAGGTGFIGTHLCRELDDRGHEVTALARDPSGAELPDGIETASGDVTAYDSVEAAVEGEDAVVNLVALSPLWKPEGGDEMHDRVHRRGTETLLRAAEAAGVERFVQLSALGADPESAMAYVRAKGRAEEAVRGADVEHVILRPSVVFGEGAEIVDFTRKLKRMFAPGLPLYPLPGGGERTRFQLIHVGDLVPMIADAVESEAHAGHTYELGGPEVYTLREVTDLVYEAEGERVTVVPLPMPLAKLGMTVMGAVPGIPLGPDQYRGLKLDNTVADNDVDAFGVDETDLSTFEEFLGIGRHDRRTAD